MKKFIFFVVLVLVVVLFFVFRGGEEKETPTTPERDYPVETGRTPDYIVEPGKDKG